MIGQYIEDDVKARERFIERMLNIPSGSELHADILFDDIMQWCAGLLDRVCQELLEGLNDIPDDEESYDDYGEIKGVIYGEKLLKE